jgi:hypothetical protein
MYERFEQIETYDPTIEIESKNEVISIYDEIIEDAKKEALNYIKSDKYKERLVKEY